jgi:hypothetical protein
MLKYARKDYWEALSALGQTGMDYTGIMRWMIDDHDDGGYTEPGIDHFMNTLVFVARYRGDHFTAKGFPVEGKAWHQFSEKIADSGFESLPGSGPEPTSAFGK